MDIINSMEKNNYDERKKQVTNHCHFDMCEREVSIEEMLKLRCGLLWPFIKIQRFETHCRRSRARTGRAGSSKFSMQETCGLAKEIFSLFQNWEMHAQDS